MAVLEKALGDLVRRAKAQGIAARGAPGDRPRKLEDGAVALAAFFFLLRPALFSLKLRRIEFELEASGRIDPGHRRELLRDDIRGRLRWERRGLPIQ